MLFLGHSPNCYIYDPDQEDWTGRITLPKKMDYSGSMYTLTHDRHARGIGLLDRPARPRRSISLRREEDGVEGAKTHG